MTSDAKIGLLLGLVFIFIIAFIINGLPSFHKDTNNNELTTTMVSLQNGSPGLAAKERKVHREVISRIEPVKKQPPVEVQTPPMDNQDIRFAMPLPKNTPTVKETVEVKTAAPIQFLPVVKETEKKSNRVKLSKSTWPKTYAVSEGDNLAVIAKKFYGDEKGNKRINIVRIFEANHKLLKSPDEICVGQKLTIPPLSASAPRKSRIKSIFSGTIFKNVESIGKRRLSNNSLEAKRTRQHIVREGDSLWQIAAKQLGNGNRYVEIIKLNTDILEDEDNVPVGISLKIPVR
jgi:nucleoid-associated protein YgaU